jgi:hypothetical protein
VRKDTGPAVDYADPDSGSGKGDCRDKSSRTGAHHDYGPGIALINVGEI